MERKEIAQQVKLGTFVLVGMTLFLVAVFFIGSENNIFSKTFTVSAVFKNVEGLKEGDNVWLSGVKIGTVSNVSIVSHGRVVVNLSLKERQNQFISRDATASVGSDGLVGNKIVVIRPGTSRDIIQDADTINTMSPADTQELINIAKDVGENTRSVTSDLKTITKKVNEGQGLVGELLNDGELSKELRLAITNLRTTTNNTAAASNELNQLLAELRHGNGLIPTMIHDTSYAQAFSQAIVNVKRVSSSANNVAQNLDQLAGKINNENNAVGVLLADSTFASRLKSTMYNAQQATDKLDENMEALQHNFLFRRYFKKKAKREEREAASAKSN